MVVKKKKLWKCVIIIIIIIAITLLLKESIHLHMGFVFWTYKIIKQGRKLRLKQGKCRLCISQTLFFHNIQRHLFLQSINGINRRKSEFLNKKVIVCDLYWRLRSYLILWKICVFTMLAFREIFRFINECARKKKAKIP